MCSNLYLFLRVLCGGFWGRRFQIFRACCKNSLTKISVLYLTDEAANIPSQFLMLAGHQLYLGTHGGMVGTPAHAGSSSHQS